MKVHVLLFSLVVLSFVAGRYMAPSFEPLAGPFDLTEDPPPQKKIGVSNTERKMLEPKTPEHFQRLKRHLAQDKTSKALYEMAEIEDMPILTPEAREKHKAFMAEISAHPELTFEVLSKTVKRLPSEFENERIRFLQLAVDLDVSREQKLELLEDFLLDGRYANEKLEKQVSKITAFDYLIEHAGVEAAKEILAKANYNKELTTVLENLLVDRMPAAQK